MQTGTLSINKLGNLIESGSFYYQEYSATSKVNMESYEVSQISNFPAGTKVVNTKNNPQTVFKSGEKFRVLIPKSEFHKNINGVIEVKSKVQNYPVFYGEGPDGYQDYAVTYETYGDEVKTENLNISVHTGGLKVFKIDNESKIPIENVEFILKNNRYGDEYKAVTNKNGEAVFSNIRPGASTLIETKTGDSYILDSTEFPVNIEYNKTAEITIGNEIKRGQLKVIKKDKDSKLALSGVTFEILNADTKEVIEEISTNENGEAVSSKLRVDKNYILRENWHDAHYIENTNEYQFSVSDNSIVEIEIENEKVKGNFKIIKSDKENENIKLQGVKFELYDKNMNLLEELITDDNGEAVSKYYPSVEEKYYLKEVQTLEEYNKNNELIEIELSSNKTIELKVENEKTKGNLKIIKVDKNNNEIKLSGVKFELYDEEMNLLEILETNEDGEAFSNKYPSVNKKYYIRETKTVNGYNLNCELINIELKGNDTLEIILENEKIPEPKKEVITKEIITKETTNKEILKVVEKEKEVLVKKLPKTGK